MFSRDQIHLNVCEVSSTAVAVKYTAVLLAVVVHYCTAGSSSYCCTAVILAVGTVNDFFYSYLRSV